jgi:CheY-like chemotaxis protein
MRATAIRSSFGALLSDEGCEVTAVADGAAALNHLRGDHACPGLLIETHTPLHAVESCPSQ